MSKNSIAVDAKEVLIQLLAAIQLLSYDEYTEKLALLSHGSIGAHTRHMIELFQQLNWGYKTNVINYDIRKRDLQIQEDIDFAADCIAEIIQGLDKPNKDLKLVSSYNNKKEITTNYFRELLYNLEHCVHHQAIIKIGLLCLDKNEVLTDFGVAKATLSYRKNVHP